MDTAPEFDLRFQVSLEFTGKPTKQYVLRFCGAWLASFDTDREACQARAVGRAVRHLALTNGWKL